MSAAHPPFSAVARGRMPTSRNFRIALLGGTILCVVSAMTWGLVVHATRHTTPDSPRADWTAGATMPPPVDDSPPAPAPALAPAPAPAPAAAANLPAPPPVAPASVHKMQIWGNGNSIAQRVADGATGSNAPGSNSNPADMQHDRHFGSGDAADAPIGPPQTDYGSRLNPTQSAPGEADVDKDISLLLPEGKDFACLPNSPIDTQLAGDVSCTVDENVWSEDGANILIDRFATVTGEIQRGLENGQDRAFILWRKVRSKRVHATLNSPAMDQLGQMGVPGEINEHLWLKVRATLLLTGVEGLANAGQSLAARGNGNSYVNFSNGQSLASQALQHDINIPTTLWRGQAWPLMVHVQHDIQFHRAYNNVLVAASK